MIVVLKLSVLLNQVSLIIQKDSHFEGGKHLCVPWNGCLEKAIQNKPLRYFTAFLAVCVTFLDFLHCLLSSHYQEKNMDFWRSICFPNDNTAITNIHVHTRFDMHINIGAPIRYSNNILCLKFSAIPLENRYDQSQLSIHHILE